MTRHETRVSSCSFGGFGATLVASRIRLTAPETDDQVVMTVRGPK